MASRTPRGRLTPWFTVGRAVSARLKLRTLPPVHPSNVRKAPLASIDLITNERPDENVVSMAVAFCARVSAYAAGVLRTCSGVVAATMRLSAPILRFKRHFTPRAGILSCENETRPESDLDGK